MKKAIELQGTITAAERRLLNRLSEISDNESLTLFAEITVAKTNYEMYLLQKKINNMKSQNNLILKHLQSGKSITPIEALEKFGSLRLSGRIYELKERGYKIKTEIIEINSGKRVAKYTLIS